jgi:cytochrome c
VKATDGVRKLASSDPMPQLSILTEAAKTFVLEACVARIAALERGGLSGHRSTAGNATHCPRPFRVSSKQNQIEDKMKSSFIKVVGFTALLAAFASPAMADGDAAAGEKVFKKCKACHTLEEGKNKVGPSLHGVMGRAAGTLEGFKFSSAMSESGLTWDDETMAKFLAKPKDLVAKTKMSFAGLKKEDDIENVIAYLKANGG